MNISAELLWVIYGVSFIILSLLAVGVARRNPSMNLAAGVVFASLLSLLIVYVIVLLNPQSYDTQDERDNISYLLWMGGIIFVISLLVALAMAMRMRNSSSGLMVEMVCDDDGQCEVTGIKQLRADEKGVHYMSIDKGMGGMISPVGHMKIEPLV